MVNSKGLSHKYEFATLKGEYGQRLFNQHPEAKNRNSVIVVDGDHIEYESTAIASLITSLPNQYKLLGLLLYAYLNPLGIWVINYLLIIEIKCGAHIGINLMFMRNHSFR